MRPEPHLKITGTNAGPENRPLILLIDDDPAQRTLGQAMLLRWNYRVVLAKDGHEGHRRAVALRPDAIVLDVKMPGLDGYTLCREIRADPDICHTPVIVATGLEDTELVERGFNAGATDFVVKPISWPLFAHRMKFILRVSAMERELRLAKQAAENVSNAKSRFIANVSHELRTPLNSIIGFTEMLNQRVHGNLGNPKYDSYAEVIHESGLHLLNIINDILEIAKCEAGTVTLSESELSLPEIADAAMRQVTPRAQQCGVSLINEVSAHTPWIRGDELRFRQILLNLIANAVKFNREGGEVRVAAAINQDDGLDITVTDTGIGIAEADIVRIKEPFQQAGTEISHRFEGAGLGVAIANEMAKLHGAQLEYSSRLGQGTTVTLSMPSERVLTADVSRDNVRIA